MLHPYSHCKTLCLQAPSPLIKELINLLCGVSCRKYYIFREKLQLPALPALSIYLFADYAPPCYGTSFRLWKKVIHNCREVELTSAGYYLLADILYYCRQFVCAYVRVRLHHYLLLCPKMNKLRKHLLQISPLSGAGVEFAV